MSFSTPPVPKTLEVPIQKEQLASNQQTVPVPLWWGRRKVAARWITAALNQKSVQANDVPTKK